MNLPYSYLYVPGDRPERLEKALRRGAGAIIADLEDAVIDRNKDTALANVMNWLDRLPLEHIPVWVRVNSGDRREHELRSLGGQSGITGFLLPKVDAAGEVYKAYSLLQGVGHNPRLAPMIESATALVNVHDIADAPGVYQLHMGEMDLAADMGLTPGPDEIELLYARSQLVVASKHAGLVPPVAPVSAEIIGLERYRFSTESLRRMGFVGRDCIHPTQVRIATEVFAPTEDEVAWAKEILAKSTHSYGAYRDSSGNMVDEAVLRRARDITTRHARGI